MGIGKKLDPVSILPHRESTTHPLCLTMQLRGETAAMGRIFELPPYIGVIMVDRAKTMSKQKHPTRRRALGQLAVLGAAAVLPTPLAARIATPRQSEGPFYPRQSMRFADQDNDLVKIETAVRNAGGEIFVLKGQVLAPDGSPASGARVEIWQVDFNGRYLHTGERGTQPRDPNFQGFGSATANANGRYRFRTIKPVTYPGRTPHIHVKVFHGGRELTSQFYIDGHPLNERDSLWRRLSEAERQSVAMRFERSAGGDEATVDIRL